MTPEYPSTRRTHCFLLLSLVLVLPLISYAYLWILPRKPNQSVPAPILEDPMYHLRSLLIAQQNISRSLQHWPSQTLVVSLPRRSDRRAQMDKLNYVHGLHLNYVDAYGSDEPVVARIEAHVRALRSSSNGNVSNQQTFVETAFYWMHTAPDAPASNVTDAPLTCATGENTIRPYKPSTKPHLILSKGMIACWLSHLFAIQLATLGPAAASPSDNGSTLVLEDDVDFDWDIKKKVDSAWADLPNDWDIVFLGYCWSKETQNPRPAPHSLLRLSYAPKCTHAYVLSQNGAVKLLELLQRPFFAFSRALDQAFVHLIRTGELEAYSIIPSVVVQMKDSTSDVWSGESEAGGEGSHGSGWRERLENSTFERIKALETFSSL